MINETPSGAAPDVDPKNNTGSGGEHKAH